MTNRQGYNKVGILKFNRYRDLGLEGVIVQEGRMSPQPPVRGSRPQSPLIIIVD